MHAHMGFRKIILMSLLVRQQRRHGHKEQSFGHSAGKRLQQTERVDWKHTLPYVKWIVSGNLLCDANFFFISQLY